MPTTEQNLMIGEELLTAVRLLKTGLRELNRMTGDTDFFDLPILLLSSGFERMMKTVICCHHLETTGEYPGRCIFPKGKKGHDLVLLLGRITKDCFSDAYLVSVPAAKADIALLRNDKRLRKIVRSLSDYGQGARYYRLNVVLGAADPGPWPDDEWQKLEMEILQDDPTWRQRTDDPKDSEHIHRQVNTELTIQCERLARSLSRLFTIGRLGAQAKQISSHASHFLCLMDHELGKTDYAKVQI